MFHLKISLSYGNLSAVLDVAGEVEFPYKMELTANTGWGADDKKGMWGHYKFDGPPRSDRKPRPLSLNLPLKLQDLIMTQMWEGMTGVREGQKGMLPRNWKQVMMEGMIRDSGMMVLVILSHHQRIIIEESAVE
ncbi:hypothetical protein SAY87_013931 [Trapa incisa]|uniref:Uncharacterized protein n=1 Tax=Trapa incisa TaxID=236973 RepID=A0AAN7QE02_9MYRT|nr:hypothetical protein SAY87_013931 [Trapa incisa]